MKNPFHVFKSRLHTAKVQVSENKDESKMIQRDKKRKKVIMGKGPEQTLFQGGHTEGPETYERILSIREMQIETTMRHHFTPDRMAIINKSTNNKC